MNDIVIGIDPGKTGAICIIEQNDFNIYDMPIISFTQGKSKKTDLNISALADMLRFPAKKRNKIHVFVEKVHSMPGQGIASTFNFGRTYGIILGIVAALGLSYTLVAPQTWKKALMSDMGKDKGASVIRGLQLYPTAKLVTERGRKIDGRGDALLIAHYGKHHYENSS